MTYGPPPKIQIMRLGQTLDRDTARIDGRERRIVERFPIQQIVRNPKTKELEIEVLGTGCRFE